MAVSSPCGQAHDWADATTRERSPLLSPNMRHWKWIPFSPESLFYPSSLTLNNSLMCQSRFTWRQQEWIFEAKEGDEQSPPVYRLPGTLLGGWWYKTAKRLLYSLVLVGLHIGADAPACTHKCQRSALPQTRRRDIEAVTQRRASLNPILCGRVLNYNER